MSYQTIANSLTAIFRREGKPAADKDVRVAGSFRFDRGSPLPFGPSLTARGANFAIVASRAAGMRLELFADDSGAAVAGIALDPRINRTGDVWHIRVLDANPEKLLALRYVWKADGPMNPPAGLYYDKERPLLDPYARAFSGVEPWGRPTLSRPSGGGPALNLRRCRISSPRAFDWEGDVPLLTPLEDTIVYELHVRGYTIHPTSGAARPGTFIGLADRIPYLQELGVTAVELMPVFEFDENENMRRHPRTGLPLLNFWGYSPIGFFCPNTGYAADSGDAGAMNEFREMVRRFHSAGLEVYLDVVFNHTAEGDERGPTISFRGLDNPTYYMLDNRGKYRNFSGCGNTFNCNHPLVRYFILDVLRYWTAVMHVDGFRFDLASILGRDVNGDVLSHPPLLESISRDPILARVKLIAEAWDAAGLNQVGNFPSYGRWSEWNGYYRDDVRRFWRGDKGMVSRFASRLCGSDDLYRRDGGGRPGFSINFITAHDGFTLNDLVSYAQKHNEDNGENNQDGENNNHSMNFGVEGPTGDAGIRRKRERQMRNLLATLFLSQGVPMLLGGDEFARTQLGNNNAYCQDNEISWVDWSLAEKNAGLIRFVRLMIAFRRRHHAFRRRNFFSQGGILWQGERENQPDWSDDARWLACVLDGGQTARTDGRTDDDFMIMANASDEWRHFAVPDRGGDWRKVVDTSRSAPDDIHESESSAPNVGRRQDRFPVEPGSLVVLVCRRA